MPSGRFGFLDGLSQDVRLALRGLRRAPGFSLTAIVILGLGIGANTTMFSAVNTVLLQPLGYHEPERLAVVLHDGRSPVAAANFLDWRRESRSFERMAAAEYWQVNLDAGDRAERVLGLRLTADMFPLLGVPAALGRVFTAEDEQPGADRKIVLGYPLWQRRFGGDPSIVGRTVTLDGDRYDVIGVMPRDFAFAPFWATGAQLWAPLSLADRQMSRGGNSLRVFARLAPQITLAQAQAEISAITGRLEKLYPGTNRRVRVVSLTERVVGNAKLALLVLLAAVGFVLLIACANVAHMLLARAAARQRELAVRLALGATRFQIVRPWLVESLVLALTSGIVGLLLATWGTQAVIGLTEGDLPRIDQLTIDGRVLAFTLALSVVTGLLFGAAPALQSRPAVVADALRDGRGSIGTKRSGKLRDLLVVSEFALAITLLVGAGLMIRSFAALQAIDPGFDPRHVLSLVVSLNGSPEAEPERRGTFYQRALERITALPGVERASAINHLPVTGDVWTRGFSIDGRPEPAPGEGPAAAWRVVYPGYFETMRLPLLRGRGFTARDDAGAARVVVINDDMARRHWPGVDPIGQRIAVGEAGPDGARDWLTIVGVTKNAAQNGWSDNQGEEVYLPYLQTRDYLGRPEGRFTYLTFVVRTVGDPAAMASSIRDAIWSLEKGVAIAEVKTLDEAIGRAVARPRFQLTLLAAFAAVALLLAAAGIYSVMSHAIARRTHEIGLRMTLGAQRGDVLRMVLGQAMARVGMGAALGLVGALAMSSVMSTLLYRVRPTDPLTFTVVTMVLVSAALLASYLPARRATRIDPMAALREP